jgi:hypothetical protein
MGELNDKYGRPILEDGNDLFFMKHHVGNNYTSSLYPRLQADRSADFVKAMMMIDILLHKWEAHYIPNGVDPRLICMPYLFKEPEQGTTMTNEQTGEIYTVTDTIRHPITNLWEGLVRIDAKTPPNRDLAEKLLFQSERARVRFVAEFARSTDTENQTDDEVQIDVGPIRPTITYSLLRKEPGAIDGQPFGRHKSYKPKLREVIRPDTVHPGHTVEIFGQWFDTLVEFNCFTTDNRSADLLIDWFERFMEQHIWVLKLNGVQEILYWQRLRDKAVTKWRQDLISRTLQYFFRIEDLLPKVRKNLSNVDIYINLAAELNKDHSRRWIAGQLVTGHLTDLEYQNLFRGPSGEFLFGDLILNDGNL